MIRTPHLRAAAGVGLLVLLSLAAATVAIAAMRWRADLMTQLDQRQDSNARLAAALTQALGLRETGAARGVSAFAADYLESPQDSIATADLQSLLRAMALEKRVDLAALNTLTPRQIGAQAGTQTAAQAGASDGTFVGVRLTFRAPLAAVQALLHTIETAQPLLFVERFAVRADAAPARGGSDAGESGPPLAVEMDVYAPKRPRALAAAMTPPLRVEPAPGALRP